MKANTDDVKVRIENEFFRVQKYPHKKTFTALAILFHSIIGPKSSRKLTASAVEHLLLLYDRINHSKIFMS